MTKPLPPLLMLIEGRKPRLKKAIRTRERELTLHMSAAQILRRHVRPDWRWSHFPAGERRDARTGAKLKRMGLQSGWPDFVLVAPDGRFHALELKRIGGDLSDDQDDFRLWCIGRGVPHSIAYTTKDVLAIFGFWNCLEIVMGESHE
jgi:hypothetical protein